VQLNLLFILCATKSGLIVIIIIIIIIINKVLIKVTLNKVIAGALYIVALLAFYIENKENKHPIFREFHGR